MEPALEQHADQLKRLAFEQCGIVTSAQASGLVGSSTVRTRLRHGSWRKICHGVLSTQNGSLAHAQQLWVAVLVAGPSAHLAGITAAAEAGVGGLRDETIRVLIPAGRRRTVRLPQLPPDMPKIRIYRTAVLPSRHCQAGCPPRTVIARSLIDAAAWAQNDDDARCVIFTAHQQRRVGADELRKTLDMFPSIRRHRLIATTIADVEGGADSLSEIDLARLCRRHHLPQPDKQHPRLDAAGRLRFIDAYWAAQRLQVEIDGAHHMEVRHWATDMLRQNQIWIEGDRILRFPAWLLRAQPSAVATQIRSALSA
jgi:very-short-patch-repair endonuclease